MMGSTNVAILTGRLGGDPELKQSGTPKVFCKFSLATSEYLRGQGEDTEWHSITVLGPRAEHCGQFLRKGSLVSVTGRIKPKKWTKDGVTQRGYEIKAFDVQFLSTNAGQARSTEKPQVIQPNQGSELSYESTGSLDDCPF